jgi:hypothetical protein
MIPINAAGQRLDIYLSPPSHTQWYRYITRFKEKKLCNAFHLKGLCSNVACEYDHSAIDRSLQEVLRYASKNRPCNQNKNGACRRLDCDRGHVCQKPACSDARKTARGCLIPKSLHNIDHNLHKWVLPTDSQKDEASDGVELSVDEERDDGTTQSSYDEGEPLIVL